MSKCYSCGKDFLVHHECLREIEQQSPSAKKPSQFSEELFEKLVIAGFPDFSKQMGDMSGSLTAGQLQTCITNFVAICRLTAAEASE